MNANQSQKKQKLSRQQDFCCKNFPDKERKSRKFSNSRQMRVIGGFTRFYASMIQICSGNFPDHADIFLSLDFLDTFLNYPDTFRIVRKLSRSPWHISRSSGLFLDYLDTFSRLSGHCLDCTETFQIIHTLFRLSGHIFQINRTLLGSSGNFQDYQDTFKIVQKLSS